MMRTERRGGKPLCSYVQDNRRVVASSQLTPASLSVLFQLCELASKLRRGRLAED